MTGRTSPAKPAYRVPSMAEIAALPWNGYRVASTFSGCGGSSLGYKLAGFRVAYANEFIPAAQETYRANHRGTHLDPRDIRTVSAGDVLAALGLARGALDLFDGSPPCASFSTAGLREDAWGKVKPYSDSAQRVDDLFDEFIRLLDGIAPRTFVAENVSGLVKGTAKGMFLDFLAKMKAAAADVGGYVVRAAVLDAQWLGVPQARQRTIFVGVRRDLAERYGVAPAFPTPLPYRYAVRDALPWLSAVGTKDGATRSADEPAPTVLTHGRPGTQSELTAIAPVVPPVEPETDIARFAIGAEWAKLAPGEQSERYFNLVRVSPDAPSPTVCASHGNPSTAGITHPTERRKFSIAELRRLCSFPDDFVLTGTYAQQWERLGRSVPPVMMAAIAGAVRDRVLNPIRAAEAAAERR